MFWGIEKTTSSITALTREREQGIFQAQLFFPLLGPTTGHLADLSSIERIIVACELFYNFNPQ